MNPTTRFLTLWLTVMAAVGFGTYAAVTNNVPISAMPEATNVVDGAYLPIIQPYPGRGTNDNFKAQVANLFRGRGTVTGTNAVFTNLTVVSNFYATNVTIFETNVFLTQIDSTNVYNNTVTIYTNSTITFNGTNLATINPTVGRIPYNLDGTNFADSALFHIDTNTVGATQVQTETLAITNLANNALVVTVTLGGIDGVLTNLANGTGFLTNNGSGGFGYYSGSFGATINPTDLYVPYRSNSTTFGNGPMHLPIAGSTNMIFDGQLILGPGTTHVLYRSGDFLIYTNDSTSSVLKLIDGTAREASVGLNGSGQAFLLSPTTGLFLQNSAQSLLFLSTVLGPNTDGAVSLGDFDNHWNNLEMSGTAKVRGFGGSSGSDYSELRISHSGTNGAVVFASQAAGTAGNARPFNFTGADVRISGLPINATATIGSVIPANSKTSDCYWTNLYATGLAAGTNVLFTVPTGMRLMIKAPRAIPTATGNATMAVNVGGVTYRVSVPTSLPSTNVLTQLAINNYVYEEGEEVAVIGTSDINMIATSGLLYTNTIPYKSAKRTSWSVGDNLVYTVPVGKYAISGTAGNSQTLFYCNETGSTVHAIAYYVPPGGSVSATTKIFDADVLTTGMGVPAVATVVEPAGTSFYLNVDSNAAGQIAWVTVTETD